MATLPITDLLALFEVLALQALDFGAQLEHFPARVLDWVKQLRGGAARSTDLYQLADHDHLGLPRRPRFGKRWVPFYPLQTDLYGRDRRSFTISLPCSDVSQSFSPLSLGSTGSKRRRTAETPLTLQRRVTTGLRPGTDFSPLATARHWLSNCQRPNGARSRRAVPLSQYAPNQAPFADNSSRFSFLRI